MSAALRCARACFAHTLHVVALPFLAIMVTSAHVGDNNTYFRGEAGPYTVQVVVRHPGVVPGLADITVRIENGPVTRVTVQPVPASLGMEGAPRPDVAQPVPGEDGLFAAQLWFMTLGSYSVRVNVDGASGSGVAVVPVMSAATRTLPMGPALGVILAALGLFLAVGLLTIVRAAVAESTLPPGQPLDHRRRMRGRFAVAIAVVLLALIASGGRAWWQGEANAYRRILFEPLAMSASVTSAAGGAVLELELADRNWLGQTMSAIVPDHGKMMHSFLVRLPAQDAFAHVHPERTGDLRFRLQLPSLPAGRYALYSDIVHETGYTQTLLAEVDLPAVRCDSCAAADPDDSRWVAPVAGQASEDPTAQISAVSVSDDDVRFADGTILRWERSSADFAPDRESILRFSALAADGSPLPLVPYMGMDAHAAVRAADGSVFVHLHPTGSISVAAQQQLAMRSGGELPVPPAHETHAAYSGTVTIPYAFPRAGVYRIWLQVKTEEGVLTGAWEVEVD